MKTVIFLTQDQVYLEKFLNFREAYEFEVISFVSEIQVQDYLSQKEVPNMILIDEECLNDLNTFLLYLKKVAPQMLRLVLTSYEVNGLFDCADKSECKMVYPKNLQQDYLWDIIGRLIKLNQRIASPEILDIMATLDHIPTVPDMFFKLNQMIHEQASMELLARTIEMDPAIASNILKLANTAFYSAKTGSIRQAMMYIGLNNIKNIILTNAVFGDEGLDPKMREIHWQHACKTNLILNAIYKDLMRKQLDNHYSSVGLLHDVGAIVLMRNFPKAYEKILTKIRENPKLSFNALEKVLIGVSHVEVGAYLLELWGLPIPMVEATLMHHEPLNVGLFYKELVCAVHLAHYGSWKVMGCEKYDLILEERVFDILGISKESFENLLLTFMQS